MIRYAIINPATGEVVQLAKLANKYIELSERLDPNKRWVYRDGEFVEAPTIGLSLGFCATPEKPYPIKTKALATADPGALDIRNESPPLTSRGIEDDAKPEIVDVGVQVGPVAGMPFELLLDIPELWKNHQAKTLLVQVDDARHAWKIAPGDTIGLKTAGLHTLQVIGPGPWRSDKLTVFVAAAPDIKTTM